MIKSPPPDPEASVRRDLTHLKVYAIDSEDTNEVKGARREGGKEGGGGGKTFFRGCSFLFGGATSNTLGFQWCAKYVLVCITVSCAQLL